MANPDAIASTVNSLSGIVSWLTNKSAGVISFLTDFWIMVVILIIIGIFWIVNWAFRQEVKRRKYWEVKNREI